MQKNVSQYDLPVASVLPELLAAVRSRGCAVLSAPPGSGKTTLVPGALLEIIEGKLIMLEPRRMAAKLAAGRIAALAGERIGGSVGYRVRGESVPGSRIEVVTEGVLVRMLQSDPELSGYGMVVFDEFHERNMAGDLALAFTLEARAALRPDLKLLLMSATLDPARLSDFLCGAPVITASGRQWPLEWRHAETPAPVSPRELPRLAARLTAAAFASEQGGILVFLPGAAEIENCAEILRSVLPENAVILPLYGALPMADQERALLPPEPGRRKVVLATNIAESSVTIDGIRVVVDSGYEKSLRQDHAVGVGSLELQRISRASAMQRAGRAGRCGPGAAYTLYTANEFRNMAEFALPEILQADLCGFLLEVIAWGAAPEELKLLDAPPPGAMAAASSTLFALGASDSSGRITSRGRRMHRLNAPPRYGALLLAAEEHGCPELGCELAALSGLRKAFADPDTMAQLAEMRRRPHAEFEREKRLYRAVLHCGVKCRESAGKAGMLLASAFPEFTARRRERFGRSYLMRCGREAVLPEGSDLAACEFLAVSRFDGASGIIRAAAPLTEAEVEELFLDAITEREVIETDPETGSCRAFAVRELGAIILKKVRKAAAVSSAAALAAALRVKGLDELEWSKAASSLRERVLFARRNEPDEWPDWSDEALLDTLELWLMPFAPEAGNFSALRKVDLCSALSSALGHAAQRRLDAEYPECFRTPAGASHRIDYSGEKPMLAVRLGELYGLREHPCVGRRRVPLVLELLSPALRPVQRTGDLPGFWNGTYKLVQKEMKQRYPKHFWPDDPAGSAPTLRVRPQR